MIRFFVQIEYDGTNYHGFQKQPKTKKTIQYEVERALSDVANHKVVTVCSGRTDAGVHAMNQFVHFDTKSKRKIESWVKGVNSYLPEDISVKNFFKVNPDMHARFSANSRSYVYVIKNSDTPPAIGSRNCLWIRKQLNVEKMHKAAQHLLGEKDFSAFRASGCQSKTPVREIFEAKVSKNGNLIFFKIKGNAFMLNMVRLITGTLIDVGMGKMNISQFKDIIKMKKRTSAGKTISANGLYFLGPEYNELDYSKEALLNELD
jgi:tRNA pseudouridine38-40 synthase